MALNLDLSPVARVIHAVGAASPDEWMLQIAVAAGALAIGWFVAHVLRLKRQIQTLYQRVKSLFANERIGPTPMGYNSSPLPPI